MPKYSCAAVWMCVRISLFAVVALIFGPALGAQAAYDVLDEIGKDEFQRSCAVCHGLDAKGDGPLAELLEAKPADLTQLSKKNKGKFPLDRVYKSIDGRWEINAHGPAEMPVWGDWYKLDAAEKYGPGYATTEAAVRGRVLELIFFIQSRQQ